MFPLVMCFLLFTCVIFIIGKVMTVVCNIGIFKHLEYILNTFMIGRKLFIKK